MTKAIAYGIVILMNDANNTKPTTDRAPTTGKYRNKSCGACGSKKTTLVVEADYTGCECKACGHSTDLTNLR